MSALDSLLATLPTCTLVVGKGGVGKTTIATRLAIAAAERGEPTLLVSTDPALALADAVGHALSHVPAAVPEHAHLSAMQLSARAARDAFLERWRDTIVAIIDRGTYLDLDDIAGLVDAALPGADEIFALLELARLVTDGHGRRLIVDTAPTGHTLRLLALPDTFRALVSLLDTMQDKHRFMVQALTHRYRRDAADEFVREMRATIDALQAVLTDPARGAALLVTRAEPVVAAESVRCAAALDRAHIRIAAVVLNALPAPLTAAGASARGRINTIAPGAPHVTLPFEAQRHTHPRGGGAHIADIARTPAAAPRDTIPLDVSLLIVGGKGGVGKTTVSCALAVAAADAHRSVLLVSTDPAPSIADALEQLIGDEEHTVRDVPGLVARQMDASAAFARFRLTYAARIDAVFDALVARGLDAAHDHAILRDLLALAPPGIDELYALASLGETLGAARFDLVVVDPAPTGHLLRLLEMPAMALDWTHRLMRLMLKYREIAALSDTARELLDFSQRTRALHDLLHDRQRAALIVVALDEPLVRAETARLVANVRALDMHVAAVIWNRVAIAPLPLPATPPVAQLVAPSAEPAPTGIEALRDWPVHWAHLPISND